jgi:hypothetical protein
VFPSASAFPEFCKKPHTIAIDIIFPGFIPRNIKLDFSAALLLPYMR